VLVIVCPGQGAQTPGFLAPWLEVPGFRDRMLWLSTVAGIDLVTHGTESDAETIKDTAIAQPLIVGAGIASLLALFEHPADGFSLVAGHSVGEITAASTAGVITAEQAMVFVRERGRLMADASAVSATGMSAVLGGDDDVAQVLSKHGLTAANNNGGGQIVAAGTLEQLAALSADPPAKSRVIPLPVAGAFHTEHMAPAVRELAALARAISTQDTRRVRLVSNRDGTILHSGRDVLERLVTQVSSPVRWDLCMETFTDFGVTGLIEIPPAGTLANLARRGLKGVEVLALKSPDQLSEAHRMVREHGQPSQIAASPAGRLIIAPAEGIVSFTHSEPGGRFPPGSVVAAVSTASDTFEVTAPHGGQVIEWLVEDGDPVSPGQPLLRLHPTAA
jgi:[acyl-carrier-protein] S-malonyltransferase